MEEGWEWWNDDRWCLCSLFNDDDDKRRRRRTIATATTPTTDGRDTIRLQRQWLIYLFMKVQIVHTTNKRFLRIPAQGFKGEKQAKQREREWKRKEGSAALGTLSWNFNFPPREHNVEQDVVHPHQPTTITRQHNSICNIGPVYNTYYDMISTVGLVSTLFCFTTDTG